MGAYDVLLSEGYLFARHGAGTYVSEVLPNRGAHQRVAEEPGPEPDPRLSLFWQTPPPYLGRAWVSSDVPSHAYFRLGVPDTSSFPFHIWRQLLARSLRSIAKSPAAYIQAQGRLLLREAIANHVSFARAVACRPENVVVTGGTQQAFDLLARILVTAGRTTVAIEDPGYPPLRAAFASAGAKLAPVPVDSEGLIVERLPADARVICVTPSHQFPMGVAMSMRRRTELLEFARRNGAVVIEDDYDGEFVSGRRHAMRSRRWIGPARSSTSVLSRRACFRVSVSDSSWCRRGPAGRSPMRSRPAIGIRPYWSRTRSLARESIDVDSIVRSARQRGMDLRSLRGYSLNGTGAAGLVIGYGATGPEALTEALLELRRLFPATGPVRVARGGSRPAAISR
jgi:DNA-binding transcriptional MocR family regulator